MIVMSLAHYRSVSIVLQFKTLQFFLYLQSICLLYVWYEPDPLQMKLISHQHNFHIRFHSVNSLLWYHIEKSCTNLGMWYWCDQQRSRPLKVTIFLYLLNYLFAYTLISNPWKVLTTMNNCILYQQSTKYFHWYLWPW